MNAPITRAAAALMLASLATACIHPDATERGARRRVSDSAAGTLAALAAVAPVNTQPGALATVASAPVVGRTGPGGKPFDVALRTARLAEPHSRRFGTVTLDITLRSRLPELTQYPCTSCHLGRKTEMRDDRITDAHRNIQPLHPKELGAHCSNCHSTDNVERLALRNGETVSIDEAYRLCAQCHVRQVNDWAAGAHGKRLDGWRGRRVVMACADCHDPHRPATEARIPFRPPRLERPRGAGQ